MCHFEVFILGGQKLIRKERRDGGERGLRRGAEKGRDREIRDKREPI